MRLMIASDIHGSAYYCSKMMDRYHEEKPDKLLLLGDILYHGPRNDLPEQYVPKEVFEQLNEIASKILCVRGNCDCEVDQMVLDFPIMAEYALLYIGGVKIYATHGHVFNKKNPLPGTESILLYGHTHVPALEEYEEFTYINPGSVSIPKENSRHSYMMFEDGIFYWKDVETGETYKEFSYRI